MQLQNVKVAVALAYVLVIVAAGIVTRTTSPAAWTALTAFALLPAAAMLTLWNHPSPTLSESISAARRR